MIYPTEKYEVRIPKDEVKMESTKAKANAGMQWLQELLTELGVFEALKKINLILTMFLDFLAGLFKALFYTAAGLLFLLSLPFVVAHVAEHWDAPEYPHSGFTPECPTWESTKDEFRRTK